jgi:hypothetical protein
VESWATVESAMPLKACRVPRARRFGTLRTASWTSAVVVGSKTVEVE